MKKKDMKQIFQVLHNILPILKNEEKVEEKTRLGIKTIIPSFFLFLDTKNLTSGI